MWLVTGGAGYIGAHVVHELLGRGEQVVVLDDLSTGSAQRVPNGVTFVEGSLLDQALVRSVLHDSDIDGVVHIAAKKQVGESVEKPLWYYRQNVTALQVLLEEMVDAGVNRIVFSSSSSVYGMPEHSPLTEDTPRDPLSPYGETKVVGERLMQAAGVAHGLRYVLLRYFNVAGAATPELGDDGCFNLIPLAFRALVAGQAPQIYGDDWPTPDGTCIRDYIHIADLARAHVDALEAIDGPAGNEAYNLGRGHGSSVREVLDVVRDVTGITIDPVVVDRRPGDPAASVAAVDKVRDRLGWTARHDLAEMVESAWGGWQHRGWSTPST